MKSRLIALYLPQFHPVEINNKYWGEGFTEWTNVAKAKPLYKGHYEPRIPADLGFYDLRLEEVREKQAQLAKQAGIEGFCYWHYWFGNGKEVLEKPLDWVIESGKPDFPLCVGWANHSWTTSTWTNAKKQCERKYIFKQEYLGEEDYVAHFNRLLPVFKDSRYIKVENKLLFLIYDIFSFTDFKAFRNIWNNLARENGLAEFYFVAYVNTLPQFSIRDLKKIKNLDEIQQQTVQKALDCGVDAVNTVNQKYAELKTRGVLYKAFIGFIRKKNLKICLEKYNYRKIVNSYNTRLNEKINIFPQILVGNDRSPRAGRKAIIYDKATPEAFYEGASKAINIVQNKDMDHRIIFVNSWNEWGEGAYMEPDLRYGKSFINELAKANRD